MNELEYRVLVSDDPLLIAIMSGLNLIDSAHSMLYRYAPEQADSDQSQMLHALSTLKIAEAAGCKVVPSSLAQSVKNHPKALNDNLFDQFESALEIPRCRESAATTGAYLSAMLGLWNLSLIISGDSVCFKGTICVSRARMSEILYEVKTNLMVCRERALQRWLDQQAIDLHWNCVTAALHNPGHVLLTLVPSPLWTLSSTKTLRSEVTRLRKIGDGLLINQALRKYLDDPSLPDDVQAAAAILKLPA